MEKPAGRFVRPPIMVDELKSGRAQKWHQSKSDRICEVFSVGRSFEPSGFSVGFRSRIRPIARSFCGWRCPRARRRALMSTHSERRPAPQGTLSSGKMVELRPESVILGIPGAVFFFPRVATPSTAVSRISRRIVGRWARTSTPRGTPPGPPRAATKR